MANKIVTSIELDLRKSEQQLQTFQKTGKKVAKKTGKAIGNNVEKSAERGLKTLTKSLLGIGALIAGAFGARAIIKGAADAEQAVQGINAALLTNGQLTKENTDAFIELGDSIEALTGITAETILEAAAVGQAFTQNAELTRELTAAAVDFAAAADLGILEATRRLGRAMQGTTDDIAKFAPEIKKLTKEQLAAGDATRILAKRFEGFAEQQAQTFTGSIKRAGNAFGQILDALGETIVKSPVVIKFINGLSDLFIKLANNLALVTQAGDIVGDFLLGLVKVGQFVAQFLLPPVEFAVRAIINSFLQLKGAALGVLSFFNEEYQPQFEETMRRLSESTASAFDFNVSDATEKFLTKTEQFLSQAKPILDDAGNEMKDAVGKPIEDLSFDNIATQMKKQAAEIKVTAKDIAKSLNQSIGRGASNAFQQFGAALATGRDALGAFGLAVLSTFGDILIQLGEQTLAVGLLMQGVPILFGLQGGAAVAAGIGMIVAGGFLKAVAGGGGAGAAAGGGAAPATAGAAPAALEAPLEPIGEVAEEIEAGPTTAVTVNVQGNILDRRETGLELVELIQESIGTQGTTLVTQGT